jgi:DNA polymerase III subunit epsilon
VVNGVVVRSWSGLIDPGRAVPEGATAVHGISTAQARSEGMPLPAAVALLADAVAAAGRRGVPLVGMRLDYDLTMVEVQAVRLFGRGLIERGWSGPVLDAAVLDRHLDPERCGRRTLVDLCAHYGVTIERPHDAMADAIASVEVVLAMASRHEAVWRGDLRQLHAAQIAWHRIWAAEYDARRSADGRLPIDPRDYLWPLAPTVLSSAA